VITTGKVSTRARARKSQDAARRESEPKRQNRAKALERRRDELVRQIEAAEARVHAISERFLDPSLFGRNAQREARKLEEEQKELKARLGELMEEWEKVEEDLESTSVSA